MHIQLHSSDFAYLPLDGNLKWLIEFPPAWSWFLSWCPGNVPRHFVDNSIWGPSRASASSAPCYSMASTPASGASSAFQMPPTTTLNPVPTSFTGPSSASASAAALFQPTFDRPQFPASSVPIQPAVAASALPVFLIPTPKQASCAPAAVGLPKPAPSQCQLRCHYLQPCHGRRSASSQCQLRGHCLQPCHGRQTQCIQQPEPMQELQTFWSDQDAANNEPPESSTLVQALRQRSW